MYTYCELSLGDIRVNSITYLIVQALCYLLQTCFCVSSRQHKNQSNIKILSICIIMYVQIFVCSLTLSNAGSLCRPHGQQFGRSYTMQFQAVASLRFYFGLLAATVNRIGAQLRKIYRDRRPTSSAWLAGQAPATVLPPRTARIEAA